MGISKIVQCWLVAVVWSFVPSSALAEWFHIQRSPNSLHFIGVGQSKDELEFGIHGSCSKEHPDMVLVYQPGFNYMGENEYTKLVRMVLKGKAGQKGEWWERQVVGYPFKEVPFVLGLRFELDEEVSKLITETLVSQSRIKVEFSGSEIVGADGEKITIFAGGALVTGLAIKSVCGPG